MAIILPSGFNITNSDPVDARFSLANQAARYALSAANIYKGLVVFQQDDSTMFVLTDTTNVGNSNGWTQIQIGAVTSNLPSGVISSSQQVIDIFNANFTLIHMLCYFLHHLLAKYLFCKLYIVQQLLLQTNQIHQIHRL